jgi:hypothetical protein
MMASSLDTSKRNIYFCAKCLQHWPVVDHIRTTSSKSSKTAATNRCRHGPEAVNESIKGKDGNELKNI